MSKRFRVLAAVTAFAGLALLAPASSGKPQEQEPKAEQKRECPCVVVPPDHEFRVHIPQIVIPDADLVRRQTEMALMQSRAWNQRGWNADQLRRAAELQAHLAAQGVHIAEQARAMALAAQTWAQQARQSAGTAILIEDGESGWLGISIYEVTDEAAKEKNLPAVRGVVVGEVESDSAAAKAGIQEGDVITQFNGQRVEGTVQFRRLVRETLAGRTVPLTVWRGGQSIDLQVEMGSRTSQWRSRIEVAPRFRIEPDFRFETFPQLELFASRTPTLGISGENLEGQLGEYFGAPDGEGVLVKEVHDGTPAEKAGMKAGDVITRIDGDRIKSLGDLRAKLREKRESKTIKVEVLRRGTAMSLDVEIEQPRPPARRVTTRRVSA